MINLKNRLQEYCTHLEGEHIVPLNEKHRQLGKEIDLKSCFLGEDIGVHIMDSQKRVKEDSRAHIMILHGLGSAQSHVRSTLHYLSIFNERGEGRKKKGKPVSTRRYINENFAFEVSAESVALPGTEGGVDIESVVSSDDFSIWLKNYVDDFRKEHPNVPLFILCRSASAMLAVHAVYQNLDACRRPMVSGLVLISPMFPYHKENPQWLELSKRDLLEFAAYNKIECNLELIDWMYQRHREIELNPSLLQSIPILTLVGERDVDQVPLRERREYKRLAEDYSLFEYCEIKEGGHDLLTSNRKFYKERIATLDKIYEFMDRCLR